MRCTKRRGNGFAPGEVGHCLFDATVTEAQKTLARSGVTVEWRDNEDNAISPDELLDRRDDYVTDISPMSDTKLFAIVDEDKVTGLASWYVKYLNKG